MLIVTIGAGRAVLDAQRQGTTMDGTRIGCSGFRVALAAGCGKVLPVGGAGRLPGSLKVVNAVTVGTDGGEPFAPLFVMDRDDIARKTDGQFDIISSGHTPVAVAPAAGFGNILAIDEAVGIIGGLDPMAGVAIRAGGGGTVAAQSSETVSAGPVDPFLLGMAGTTAKGFLLDSVGNLMGAVAGETVHRSLCH